MVRPIVVTRPRSDVTTIKSPYIVAFSISVVTRPRSDVTTIFYKGELWVDDVTL